MRTCLFLTSALALVSLATAVTTIYPNDESEGAGFYSLVERTTSSTTGTRVCSLVDRGESQAYRNLAPFNNQKQLVNILRRNTHDERVHHSHAHQEENDEKELFELNTNHRDIWSDLEQSFMERECDSVAKVSLLEDDEQELEPELEMDLGRRVQDVFRIPQGTGKEFSLQEEDEVRKLVDSGPDKNRVGIVFMGDGYTLAEREKFFGDMNRLVNDMFIGDTFESFLPLFNVYALFRPSRESGIGTQGKWRDTSFRLYRDGTELRGIYCADPLAAKRACRAVGKYACDFPSLIGNDPYYGGLGGQFVISTSSNKSGTVVLRHELGHSLIDVGEEYDGGQVYSGVNAERWSIQNIKWKHWITDDVPREEKNVLRAQDYAWYDLAKGPYKVKFESNGEYKRWSLKISHSGVDTDDSFEVYLDGKRLDWTSPGGYDRDFSEWFGDEGFSAGSHEIEFRHGAKYDNEPVDDTRPIRQLCSVTMHEFMGEDEYRYDNSIISAYPTYDIRGRKTWRPSNEFCLMRNMTSTHFCSVCKEGLWHRLLSKASLLDEIQVDCGEDVHGENVFDLSAKLIPLGQFREDQSKRSQGEIYETRWFKNGAHQAEYDNRVNIQVSGSEEGIWEFKTEFKTPEVRKDPRGLLKASKVFVLAKRLCSK